MDVDGDQAPFRLIDPHAQSTRADIMALMHDNTAIASRLDVTMAASLRWKAVNDETFGTAALADDDVWRARHAGSFGPVTP